VIILLLLTGCSEQMKTAKPIQLTIAEGSQPTAGLIYIAQLEGYFADQGLEVTLQPHQSGKACLDAVLDNIADLGAVAETPSCRQR
jgi:ABC-type nitrate/sulfonate/bicarbonate transport system substrate-binding protein